MHSHTNTRQKAEFYVSYTPSGPELITSLRTNYCWQLRNIIASPFSLSLSIFLLVSFTPWASEQHIKVTIREFMNVISRDASPSNAVNVRQVCVCVCVGGW